MSAGTTSLFTDNVVDDKCTGLAVHICARIVALANPDEILVSQAVCDAAGSGFQFVERGTHTQRGIPGEWRLSALVAVPDVPPDVLPASARTIT